VSTHTHTHTHTHMCCMQPGERERMLRSNQSRRMAGGHDRAHHSLAIHTCTFLRAGTGLVRSLSGLAPLSYSLLLKHKWKTSRSSVHVWGEHESVCGMCADGRKPPLRGRHCFTVKCVVATHPHKGHGRVSSHDSVVGHGHKQAKRRHQFATATRKSQTNFSPAVSPSHFEALRQPQRTARLPRSGTRQTTAHECASAPPAAPPPVPLRPRRHHSSWSSRLLLCSVWPANRRAVKILTSCTVRS
jgi:hypothetical protein